MIWDLKDNEKRERWEKWESKQRNTL